MSLKSNKNFFFPPQLFDDNMYEMSPSSMELFTSDGDKKGRRTSLSKNVLYNSFNHLKKVETTYV